MTLRGVLLGSQILFLLLLLAIAAFVRFGDKVDKVEPLSAEVEPRELEGRSVPLVFPLLGEALLTDSFGDPRPGDRRHQGVDIMAPKLTPVIAAAAGTVAYLRTGRNCCSLTLRHDGGWTTRYLHLNNDTEGTDDGQGRGVMPGLEVGTMVRAGEVIGWVGDSGNAESTAPHLHFELRDPERQAVDPYPSLLMARGESLEGS